ncbi:MAG: S8 family serine peptidase [Chloroflexia bacterium]
MQILRHAVLRAAMILGLALLLLMPLAPSTPASAARPTPDGARKLAPAGTSRDWVAGRVLVKMRSGGGATLDNLRTNLGLAAVHGKPIGGVVALDGAAGLDVAATVAALRANPDVEYAEPDYITHADLVPNDPHYADDEWWLTAMQAQAAWDISTGNPGITIAVLDTGIATDHPDFAGRIIPGHNFVSNNSDVYDDNGHGTHVSGIASAAGNNGVGIAGISWQSKILPGKVLNAKGQGSTYDFAQGIRWAADNGARVINISAGADFSTETEHDAIKYARSKGTVIVAAAGNTPDGRPEYPAGYDEVIAVSASSQRDSVAGFSSYGDYVDLAAPGINILSTWVSNHKTGYMSESGTSMASPMVAGAAALVLSINPNLTPDQVQLLLEETADDIGDPGFDQKSGWGRVNLLHALQQAPNGPPDPNRKLPPTKTPPGSSGSKVQGTVTGVSPDLVDVLLLPQNGAPPRDIQPDAAGLYVFDNLPAGKYTVQIALKAGGYNFPAPQTVEVSGGNDSAPQVNFTLTARVPEAFAPVPAQSSTSDLTYFPQVQHTLRGPFLRYWTAHGGLPIFGYPVGEEFQEVSLSDGKEYTVQYFQRNRFEYHPDLAGTPNEVLLGLLGVEVTKGRTFDPAPAGPTDATHQWFPQVKHNLGGAFLRYWQTHGGLAVFGYPISDEFPETSPTNGKTYTVQYFQRNRFELHPEFTGTPNEVLLGLLGVDVLKARGWLH